MALAIGVVAAGSCLSLSWKEGIACDVGGHCPGDLTCCSGACRHQCPTPDAATATDGPPAVTCPAEVGGCFACMPGCACACGATQAVCCLQFGVATCAGCP